MSKVSIELFLYLVCTNSRVIIWLWRIPLLLCKRNCLAFRNLSQLVSVWTRVVFNCYISYFWSITLEIDNVSSSLRKEGIVFIWTWKFLMILVFRNLNQNSYCFALLELILYFIEFSRWSANDLIWPITFPKGVFGSSHIRSYIILSNIWIFPFLSIGSRSAANTKGSLRPFLWKNYLLNAFRSMIVGL